MDTNTLFSSDKKDWETPDWLYRKLDEEFRFFWDAAADEHNKKRDCFIGLPTNALETSWSEVPLAHEGAWWLNPPYGRDVGKWIQKAWQESQKGLLVVVLCAARTDTDWWHRYAMRAAEIRLIRGRLRFKGAPSAAPFPSAILVFKPPNVNGIRVKWSVIDARGQK